MNLYDFFIYEFIYFMDSYMNSGVPRFQMHASPPSPSKSCLSQDSELTRPRKATSIHSA